MPPTVHRLLSCTLLAACFGVAAAEDIKAAIGYTELKASFGSALPDGSNISILQVEAPESSGNWRPKASGVLSYLAIAYPIDPTICSGTSAHATLVAKNLCGTSTSVLPNLGTLMSAGCSKYRSLSLKTGMFTSPAVTSWDVENHSYVGTSTTYDLNGLQLLDYRINRDGVTVCVGLMNGTGVMPPLWGNCYNTITVGTATGKHSRGGTNLEGGGRQKPDLVGPVAYTSYSTPVVASVAGFLIAECKRTSALAVAKDPRTIKALLMAGATKERFPAWSHSVTAPLDAIYGAGQVNVDNSYRMLVTGRQPVGKAWRALKGWDLDQSGSTAIHYFEVPAGQTLKFSTVLTWHSMVADNSYYWSMTRSLAPLDLRLRSSDSSFALGAVVAESTSAIDNVEHIYCPTLPAGRYALEVVGPAGSTYGLAWNGILSGAVANTAPTIANIANQSATVGSAKAVTISVGDAQTAVSALTVTAMSSNPVVVPAAGLVLSGTTASRSLSIIPAAAGSATITVTVKDAGGLTITDTFVLTAAAAPVAITGDTTDDGLGTVTARGQINATEGRAKAFDNNPATKWLDKSPSGSWLQYAYAAGQKKAVSSYSITSANDHSERDPADWQLLGSNDGGATWTTVDSQTGVLFTARQQKQVFQVAAPAAFAIYRLKITKVRNPATANSVQLAELELLIDPAPAASNG